MGARGHPPSGSPHATGEKEGTEAAAVSEKNKKAGFQPDRGYSKDDWDTVSDSPEATDEELAQAKPFAEVFPELAEAMRRNLRQPTRS